MRAWEICLTLSMIMSASAALILAENFWPNLSGCHLLRASLHAFFRTSSPELDIERDGSIIASEAKSPPGGTTGHGTSA